jgi:hypothetical protein
LIKNHCGGFAIDDFFERRRTAVSPTAAAIRYGETEKPAVIEAAGAIGAGAPR